MLRTRFILPFLGLTVGAACAFGQATSGDLVGTVKDASGALVANAQIKVTDEATGVTTVVTTSASGEFRASNLLPDKYDVNVTAAGFQGYDLKGVLVELNKTSTENVTLSIGSATAVEVVADAGVVLDTTSTNLSQTFDAMELDVLPTTSANILNASLLSPGVASGGGIGIGTGPSVGGQRPRNNNFTIEGIDNNSKSVTGPLVYIPQDAVGSFTLITNQFSPEFGHSSGGQFNTNVTTGTNHFHGKLYEYFQNRNLNAAEGAEGQKQPNTRYDNNRYGGQLGGPILRDKLFFFGNYERQAIGSAGGAGVLCTPTAAGLATLNSLATTYGFAANNLAVYEKYMPASATQVTNAADGACFNPPTAANPNTQALQVFSGIAQNTPGVFESGNETDIPLGNYPIVAPSYSNFWDMTVGVDYTITNKDNLRVRYLYNNLGSQDTAATLPVFWLALPTKWHLFSLSEFHTFTPNLTNEVRLGYNRNESATPAGPQQFPGLAEFPNLTFYDQDGLNIGPDGNAPQSGIQNLYQVTDNVSYVRGKHSFVVGFDGRKYIAPQTFTQRVRGDYQWDYLSEYLHDLAPTDFGERSTGDVIYYGDQTALYGYFNDTWRATPTITVNAGLRYEFTSVPFGERAQELNAAASAPGVINFHTPQPQYTNFAPRLGINWAPDGKTSVRAGFGMAYDVLFDNLGLLTFPPQYSSTNDVNTSGVPVAGQISAGAPGFLAGGGLPSGGSGIATFPTIAAQRAATSATVPDQVLPYAETYTLTVQRTIGSAMTAELGYVGTRGIHLATQDQINVQPKVTAANQLTTSLSGPLYTDSNGNTVSVVSTGANVSNLAAIESLSNIVPKFLNPPDGLGGFTNKITSYQPFSQSDYNGLVANLQRRLQNGLQMDLSYTWSKTMDDATAEVFATVLTPRRQQNSQCISCDYSTSALNRANRFSGEVLYDLPFFKHSNFLLKNLVGNWTVSTIYTYESPEAATALSGVNSNLNGDSGSAIDRPIVNDAGNRTKSSLVYPQYSNALAANCPAGSAVANGVANCLENLTGYVAVDPTAYYIQAAKGTLPTAQRNTLPIRPIDNIDMSAYKKITFFDHYDFQFGAQAFNVLNHAQYLPGSIDSVSVNSYTSSYAFQTVGSSAFEQPGKIFGNNPRSMILTAKIVF